MRLMKNTQDLETELDLRSGSDVAGCVMPSKPSTLSELPVLNLKNGNNNASLMGHVKD